MLNILYRFRNIWKPEIFQGNIKSSNYFEGWYYKLVDNTKNEVIAIIPGIFCNKEQDKSHAFVQVFHGMHNKSDFFAFPIEKFYAAKNKFKLVIDQNEFSTQRMVLNLPGDKISIFGDLKFTQQSPWPNSFFSPGAMGPYSFAPLMQCNHAVISMDHEIHGSLEINNQKTHFDNGRGYIEKDWGKGFPSAYVWLQCNHFETNGISLFASIAKVPWITGSFRGLIIGFLYAGTLYRFATYTGAILEYLNIGEDYTEFAVSDKQYNLQVKVKKGNSVLLHAPYDMQFIQRASESLTCEVNIKLTRRNTNSEGSIYEGKGYPAALDVNGKLEEIANTT
jgi:hypothetical protein